MLAHVFNSTVVSGPETLVLPALPRLGEPVAVVFLCEKRREAECLRCVDYARSFGLITYEVWVRSRYDRQAISGLAATLIRLQPSIVHAHDVKASTYALKASRVAEVSGRKTWQLVSTHHGVRGRSGLKIKAFEWFYTHFVLPDYDRVLAVCNSDRSLLISRGLSSDRVLAHLNGVNGTAVAPANRPQEQERIRKAWALSQEMLENDEILIGFIGRLAPEKRLNRILAICSCLQRNHPNIPSWRLVAFGIGMLEPQLKTMTETLGLTKRVLWMGYRSGVGHELAGFDIVISLSDAEGLPINLVEAGWGGTPVFATRVDGNIDLIPDESQGILVEVSESNERIAARLASLIADPTGRSAIGKAFQQRVSACFSGERWLEDLRNIYRGLRNGNLQNNGIRHGSS